ncbi:MAG TPA: hypothetical protein VL400_25070, partial [Polyangiaceae bacterium]|nr:hypothetical protein [Polyangiaceae bacterium]
LGEATRQPTARLDGAANDAVANGASGGMNGAAHAARAAADQIDDALATLRRFEAFAAEEAKRVSTKLVPETEAHVKKNVWTSLLIALGIGLVLGLWLNGGRRRG